MSYTTFLKIMFSGTSGGIHLVELQSCWCHDKIFFPQDSLISLHLKIFWTRVLNGKKGCVFPCLGWIACNYLEKKNKCSEKSYATFVSFHFPPAVHSLLLNLHCLPFLTLVRGYYCSHLSMNYVLYFLFLNCPSLISHLPLPFLLQ